MLALAWQISNESTTEGNDNLQTSTSTTLMLVPADQTPLGGTAYYVVQLAGNEFSDLENDENIFGLNLGGANQGDLPDPPEWFQVNGQTLIDMGVTNDDGTLPGYAIVSGPAGAPVTVTLTSTQYYTNNDQTFPNSDVTVSNLTLEIVDANTGNNLSAQTNTVIVGQQMNLTCQLSMTNATFMNSLLTNFQWTVPGLAISNYVVAPDTSSATVVTNFPLGNTNVVFYWVNGANNRTVQCSATVNGTQMTGQAVFNVVAPTAQISTYTTSVGIFPLGSYDWLLFDSFSGPGIIFSNSIVIPPNFSGSVQWVQIDFNPILNIIDTNSVSHTNSQSTFGPYLDTTYPYHTTNASGFPVDTPGDELPNGNEYTQVQGSDTFEMWMMFQPTNGIPVPLRAVNWSWSGAATNYLGGWFLKSGSNSTNPSDFPTTVPLRI
jgi:hypothetical protein